MMNELSEKRSANQDLKSMLYQCIAFDTVMGFGGWKESSMALNIELLYWGPEADNFPNIDATILIDSTVHCLQCFVSKDGIHFFGYRTFEKYFLKELPKDLHVKTIIVHFVTATEVVFHGVKLPVTQKKACENMITASCEVKWYDKKSSIQEPTSNISDTSRELRKRSAVGAPGFTVQNTTDFQERAITIQ